MPCNSDYLAATGEEKAHQRAAQLLVYVIETCNSKWPTYGGEVPNWLRKEAQDIYAADDRSITELCAKLKSLSSDVRDQLVYNAYDRQARDLANWWEKHEEADRARERAEAEQRQRDELRRSAISKLTPAERAALGLRGVDDY